MPEETKEPNPYNPKKTATATGIPLIVMVAVECTESILPQLGITIDKGTLYQIGIAVYAGIVGIIHWAKNKHRV